MEYLQNINNYNFKIILLIILYFSRRLLTQLYHHYRIKEHLIFTTNKLILTLIVVQLGINVLYIFWDLILNYSVYSLLPLFYFSLLHVPIFRLDGEKRYENASTEMMRTIKSKKYYFKKILINFLEVTFLSLEVCYYGIFIPVFFSMKFSPFLNMFAVFIYTIFTWINCALFLFAFYYYKKSAEFHFHTKIYGSWKRMRKDEIPQEKLQ